MKKRVLLESDASGVNKRKLIQKALVPGGSRVATQETDQALPSSGSPAAPGSGGGAGSAGVYRSQALQARETQLMLGFTWIHRLFFGALGALPQSLVVSGAAVGLARS